MENENNKLEENMVDWRLFSDRIGKVATVRTGISCPFSCNFCLYPKLGGQYQYVSVDAIEEELNALESVGKVKSVYFMDDTFNIPPQRFKEILRMIIRNKYSFKWHSFFRCQFADAETVELMKESGCEGVLLGIESGSQKILDNMNKLVTVEQYKNGIGLLNEYGIPAMTSYIVGFPGETQDTVKETMNFIEETRASFYQAFVWYAAKGAPVWDKKEHYGLKGQEFNWSHNTMDVQTACDMVENMFLNIKNSTWVPKNNFHNDGIFFLRRMGMNIQQIKEFCDAFNGGVREKLMNPQNIEISKEIMQRIVNACVFIKSRKQL
jgi:radical SAM PhpK family P-methyltransferase